MRWSSQQSQALDDVGAWLKSPGDRQVFYLAGYAGTGKTTLAKHLAESCDGFVQFCAFTGKAAYVLTTKGCDNATTIHRLIYQSMEKSKQHLRELQEALAKQRELVPPDEARIMKLEGDIAQEKRNLKRPSWSLKLDSDIAQAKLVVVDECSMVDERMGEDLMSFGVPILVLGDPAQLPPVGGGGFFTGRTPDVMLTEIHRQAADNPVLRLATQVRQGEKIDYGTYGTSRVIEWDEIDREAALGADQIIVGKNETRRKMNQRIRNLLGYGESMVASGERLICLRNDHDLGLLNGAIWYAKDAEAPDADRIRLWVTPEEQMPDGNAMEVVAHTAHFDGAEVDYWDRKNAAEFDYGHAITCHKSQGSEWPDVLIFDQSRIFRKSARNWLYTAITRASERVTIAR